jgi:N4-gp56 family major capsid protein
MRNGLKMVRIGQSAGKPLSAKTYEEASTTIPHGSTLKRVEVLSIHKGSLFMVEDIVWSMVKAIAAGSIALGASGTDSSASVRTQTELAAELYDDYLQKELLGACGIEVYGGTATSLLELTGEDSDVKSEISYDLIRKVQNMLKANHAKKHTTIITGSTKVGTVPVSASYFAYCGQDSTVELEKLKDDFDEKAFTPARMYAAAGNLAKGEVGAVHSTRFIEAERMMKYDGCGVAVTANSGGYQYTTLTAAQADRRGHGSNAGDYYDGFPIIWVTKGAFSTVGLQGNNKVKFLAKKPSNDPTAEDPYALMGIYSFNFFAGSIALEPEKMARLVHVARG